MAFTNSFYLLIFCLGLKTIFCISPYIKYIALSFITLIKAIKAYIYPAKGYDVYSCLSLLYRYPALSMGVSILCAHGSSKIFIDIG